MQSSDTPDGKEIKDLQQLWQQTITTNSLKIKEREMLREMQRDMDTFDEKYGFGTWKTVILSGFLSLLLVFSATRHILRGNHITPMEIVQFLYPVVFFFQLWTRLESRKYDMSKTEDYYAFSLARVRRQMSFIRLGMPFMLGLMVTWFVIDYDNFIQSTALTIILSLMLLATVIYSWWQYKYRLIPLRNNLRDALFDIRNPYPMQNDENS